MDTDDTENEYASYGMPLDPLDESDLPRKKPQSIEDQIVTDENGRRRFHGAFTGGFSAGYFNTVGSKEGWAPSSFRSSRKKKTQLGKRTAEDYMDSEDFGEFGIAPKVLKPTAEFLSANEQKQNRQHILPTNSFIAGTFVEDLIKPVVENIGMKLMNKMGWKLGQGIGPRISKREKRKQKLKNDMMENSFGCALPPAESSSDEEADSSVTYAPEDVKQMFCNPKVNVFGLGYKGLDRDMILPSNISLYGPSLTMTEKKKKISITGQAFGVGAFEDEDEDIYTREDMSKYDFELSEDEPQKKPKARMQPSGNNIIQVLEGFHLCDKRSIIKKTYPPPQLPKHFHPVHGIRQSRFEPMSKQEEEVRRASRPKGLDRHNLSAQDRQAIIADATEKAQAAAKKDTEQERIERLKLLSALSVPTAGHLAEKSGFRPFAKDSEKEIRYETYKKLVKEGHKELLSDIQPASMTEWEKERERVEFDRASLLYQPLSGDMASRFVTSMLGDESKSEVAVIQPVPVKIVPSKIDTEKEAIQAKMYGKLTRTTINWHPDRILCKRFNVPDPYPDSDTVGIASVKRDKISIFNFLDASKSDDEPQPSTSQREIHNSTPEDEKQEETKIDIKVTSEVVNPVAAEAAVVNVDEKTAAKPPLQLPKPPDDDTRVERPPMDLFRAIFQNSDSESDDEKPSVAPDAEVSTPPTKPITTEPSEFVKKPLNRSPPRGLFANLDLDALSQQPIVKPQLHVSRSEPKLSLPEKCEPSPIVESIDTASMYGPALPPVIKMPVFEEKPRVSSDSALWIEKGHKKHKSKKEHHHSSSKHKKHKSKHKHKSKSKKNRKSKDTQSSDSDSSSS